MDVSITFTRKGGFGKLGPKTMRLLDAAVKKTAFDIETDAKLSIMTGPKTGRTYKRGKGEHQASAPGEPPATDYGNLVNGISTEHKKKLESWVVSAADYSLDLELGTENMEARPFMKPAVEQNEKPFFRACAKAVRDGAR